MNRYEGMFILKSDINKDGLDKIISHIQEIIVKHKGSVEEIKEWSRQRLAYPIKNIRKGFIIS